MVKESSIVYFNLVVMCDNYSAFVVQSVYYIFDHSQIGLLCFAFTDALDTQSQPTAKTVTGPTVAHLHH